MIVHVNVHEAKTHLSRLLRRVADGDEVVISRAGTPVARLLPYDRPAERRKPGGWEGRVWMAPDFDDWTPELESMFYGDRGEPEADGDAP